MNIVSIDDYVNVLILKSLLKSKHKSKFYNSFVRLVKSKSGTKFLRKVTKNKYYD